MDKDYGKGTCPYCGVEFQRKYANQKYCCKKHGKYTQHNRWLLNNKNYAKQKTYQKERKDEMQKKVYALLGKHCVNCGESDPIVLSLDHIEPVGKNRRNTIQNYYEILSMPEKAKEKYQLLCRNCNWRKLILNNERKLKTTVFAYKWEIDLLHAKIKMLESRLNNNKSSIVQSSSLKTEFEIAKKLVQYKKKLLDHNGKINATDMRILLKRDLGITVGHNKAYTIKHILESQSNG